MGILLEPFGIAVSFTTLYDFISRKFNDDNKVFKNQLRKNIMVICEAAREAFNESPEFANIIPSFVDDVIYEEVINALENKRQVNIDEMQKKLNITRRDIFEQLIEFIDIKLQTSFEYSQRDYNAWARQKATDIESLLGNIINEINEIKKILTPKNSEQPKTPKKRKTIFLSYCNIDSPIADLIEEKLISKLSEKIKITRYTKDVNYRESFKNFMNSISEHDFVITIVSDAYLKSQPCMYEAGELIKDNNFAKKILFVVISDNERKYYKPTFRNKSIGAKIYSDENQIKYVTYWERQYKNHEKNLEKINSNSAKISTMQKMAEIKKIIDYDIRKFMDYLADSNGKTFEEFFSNSFRDFIVLIDQEYNQFQQCNSFEELFKSTILELYRITGTDYNQLILRAATDSHTFGLIVLADIISPHKQHYRIVVSSGLISKATEGLIMNIGSVRDSNVYFSAVPETMSELVMPIRINNSVVGVFNSESEELHHYSDSMIAQINHVLNDFSITLKELGYESTMTIDNLPYVSLSLEESDECISQFSLISKMSSNKIVRNDYEFNGMLQHLFLTMRTTEQLLKLLSLLSNMKINGGINIGELEEIHIFDHFAVEQKNAVISFYVSWQNKPIYSIEASSIEGIKPKIVSGLNEVTLILSAQRTVIIAFDF